jgi:hypothetical protein
MSGSSGFDIDYALHAYNHDPPGLCGYEAPRNKFIDLDSHSEHHLIANLGSHLVQNRYFRMLDMFIEKLLLPRHIAKLKSITTSAVCTAIEEKQYDMAKYYITKQYLNISENVFGSQDEMGHMYSLILEDQIMIPHYEALIADKKHPELNLERYCIVVARLGTAEKFKKVIQYWLRDKVSGTVIDLAINYFSRIVLSAVKEMIIWQNEKMLPWLFKLPEESHEGFDCHTVVVNLDKMGYYDSILWLRKQAKKNKVDWVVGMCNNCSQKVWTLADEDLDPLNQTIHAIKRKRIINLDALALSKQPKPQ